MSILLTLLLPLTASDFNPSTASLQYISLRSHLLLHHHTMHTNSYLLCLSMLMIISQSPCIRNALLRSGWQAVTDPTRRGGRSIPAPDTTSHLNRPRFTIVDLDIRLISVLIIDSLAPQRSMSCHHHSVCKLSTADTSHQTRLIATLAASTGIQITTA